DDPEIQRGLEYIETQVLRLNGYYPLDMPFRLLASPWRGLPDTPQRFSVFRGQFALPVGASNFGNEFTISVLGVDSQGNAASQSMRILVTRDVQLPEITELRMATLTG